MDAFANKARYKLNCIKDGVSLPNALLRPAILQMVVL